MRIFTGYEVNVQKSIVFLHISNEQLEINIIEIKLFMKKLKILVINLTQYSKLYIETNIKLPREIMDHINKKLNNVHR